MGKKTESNIIGLLGVVFVTLKLCGVISWSWWWVTLPFYGWLVFRVVVTLIESVVLLRVMVIKYFINGK